MAIKRGNDFITFTRNFKNKMLQVDDKILNEWTKETGDIMANAQRLAPIASGTLEGSAVMRQARLTGHGIESAVLFKVDYAAELNKKDTSIVLKNKGEVSYYLGKKKSITPKGKTRKGDRGGVKVIKQRKGRKGFLDIAVRLGQPFFNKIVSREVSKQFLKI